MAAQGLTAQEIADLNFISVSTVNNALAEAKDRAGAKNITHLVALCVASGLIAYRD